MNNERMTEIARKWNVDGNGLNFSPDNSRLLIRVWRTLAKGLTARSLSSWLAARKFIASRSPASRRSRRRESRCDRRP